MGRKLVKNLIKQVGCPDTLAPNEDHLLNGVRYGSKFTDVDIGLTVWVPSGGYWTPTTLMRLSGSMCYVKTQGLGYNTFDESEVHRSDPAVKKFDVSDIGTPVSGVDPEEGDAMLDFFKKTNHG